MDNVEKFIVDDRFTVTIHQDEDAESPREWDNIGVMVCFHRRYTLGDKHSYAYPESFRDFLEEYKPPVVLPLYLLDHSGLRMSTGDFSAYDPGEWDSGQVGFIYVTAEKIKSEFGEVNAETIARARKCAEGEVETYDRYLAGDVYGYVVEGPDGEQLDSCWGFFGVDDAMAEGKKMAEYHAESTPKQLDLISEEN